MNMRTRDQAYILISFILIQSIFSITLTNQIYMNMLFNIGLSYKYAYPISMIVNVLGLGTILCVYYVIKILRAENESMMKLNHSKEVIDALQGQKHDFNNHLNVLAGMLQIGKPDKALEYIFTLSQKVDGVFSVSKIKHVEIGAILCRKCAIAESKGITVELDIETSLDDLKILPLELCKIIFNLLDNAIFELEHCHEEEKLLTIDILEHNDIYHIAIGNSFPVLPLSLYDEIFKQEYSTKEGEGHGYGLAIVKQIIEKNGGRITVESYEDIGTIFTVFLPKKKSQQGSLTSM